MDCIRIKISALKLSVLNFFFIVLIAGISIPHAENLPPIVADKKVFAHYMVCCPTYGESIDSLKKEIKEAQAGGIDGFALNCGGWLTGNYKAKALKIYDAA